MKKKDYPLAILQQLNHFKSIYPKECKVVKLPDCLIRYEDIDTESEFYFEITSFAFHNSDFVYSISYKPSSGNSLTRKDRVLNFSEVEKTLYNWGNLIKEFNEIEFFNDDPITEFYTKEFYDEYKILEDDADVKPFAIKQQILINSYLDSSIKLLDKYEKRNPDVDLSEPKNIAIKLKGNLTELTKNQVILKLSQFWALTRKKGLPILKEIFFELAKELLNEFGKKMLGI